MENSVNPTGTNIINNLTALKIFSIATAIQKNLYLASCSFYLFLERKELIKIPLNILFSEIDKKIIELTLNPEMIKIFNL